MAQTKYSHLTDEEFLRYIDDARPHSPMIEELAVRLEKRLQFEKTGSWTLDCPVCEASINCVIDNDEDKPVLERQ
jgi:hypothetical protein